LHKAGGSKELSSRTSSKQSSNRGASKLQLKDDEVIDDYQVDGIEVEHGVFSACASDETNICSTRAHSTLSVHSTGMHQYASCNDVQALLNSPNPMTGQTVLYAAVFYPNEHTQRIVERLVQRSANPNLSGLPSSISQSSRCSQDPEALKYWEPPLAPAVRRGETSLVAKLLDLRSDVNARDGEGNRILQVGVERGDRETLATLLACTDLYIDTTDLKGRTALVTALTFGYVELASDLIHAACNVDARDHNGASPLLHAINVHDSGLSRLLLLHLADMNAVDPADGSHVLHLAAQTRNVNLIEELLAAGTDVRVRHPKEGRTALHVLVGLRGMASVVSLLLEFAAEVDAQTHVGDTPLRIAVISRDIEAVEILCKARADPNCSNRSGCAAIHAAVAAGDMQLTEMLVGFGADVHLADSRRWCPVHYGASGGSGAVIEQLINSRADPYARSYHGRTPKDLGRADAADALGKAALRNPPPQGMLEPGPPEVPRPVLAKRSPRPAMQATRSTWSSGGESRMAIHRRNSPKFARKM
jgi:ankyrin repeat protein